MELLRAAVKSALRVHPRIAQQNLMASAERRAQLLAVLPPLVPFRVEPPWQIVALLDWDHRLPTQRLLLRIYLNYDEVAASRFEAAHAERVALISARDLYPEFDVPDFEELPSDESYEAELTTGLFLEGMHLASPWRREIPAPMAERAVAVVRASVPFARVRAAESSRPAHLGDLDPVSWMPPCESGYARWTVDVWWLTSFDGRSGAGWSFLVDLETAGGAVVTHREFSVRAS